MESYCVQGSDSHLVFISGTLKRRVALSFFSP